MTLWKCRQQKCFKPLPKAEPFQFGQSSWKLPVTCRWREDDNTWGAVLQEQNQDAVAAELGILEVEGTVDRSRQSETDNYLLRNLSGCLKNIQKN